VFLVAETEDQVAKKKYDRLAKIFLAMILVLSVIIFLSSPSNKRDDSYHLVYIIGISAFSLAALMSPLIFYLFKRSRIIYLRVLIGFQVSMAILGWFTIRFPILVSEKNGHHLDFFNSAAPAATLYQLLIALFVGLALIIPAFYFLFKVFKKTGEKL